MHNNLLKLFKIAFAFNIFLYKSINCYWLFMHKKDISQILKLKNYNEKNRKFRFNTSWIIKNTV